jgi:hypothetical protein
MNERTAMEDNAPAAVPVIVPSKKLLTLGAIIDSAGLKFKARSRTPHRLPRVTNPAPGTDFATTDDSPELAPPRVVVPPPHGQVVAFGDCDEITT